MAVPPPLFRAVPAPTRDEAETLRLAEAYLQRAGTQVASRLLGCPDRDYDVVLAAELSDALLRSPALCAGLRDRADPRDHHRRL